ncbi:AAA-ATPase At2g46620-like [Phalaenopsis equestris]|uniref:AAA-ATPase At2g46620-like n=1 Tax=Phalaenopsis equestris TaxID=78828 RepID=UPI0009E65AF3|nr:AAA-ATPase At2g46620-like [Phalaenopsis equestris]
MIASSAASFLQATAVSFFILILIRTILSFKSLIHLLNRFQQWFEDRTQSYQTFKIPLYNNDGLQQNPLHRKAAAYTATLSAVEDSDVTNLFSSNLRSNEFSARLAPGQTVQDSFLNARLSWTSNADGDLVLRLRRQDRYRVLRPYLQHVENTAEEIEIRRMEIRLYTNSPAQRWRGVGMTHPATLETVVMDPVVKSRVKADLESFLKGRSYYARLGRVWKRSYLLQGAPGTGKSSFAAAMARYLRYNVYDLDLSLVSNSADLRFLLLNTTPRSLILVEDLDRYYARSWMLNFMDGVFSCCGEERVMVCTVSGRRGVDAIDDPAVIRPGRIDVRIHFPLCDFTAFKTLASCYLGLKDHKLYEEVEEGFQSGGRISPAEVGEIMIANRGSSTRAIKSVINALHRSVSSGAVERMSRVRDGGFGVRGIGKRKEATVRELRKLYGYIRLRSAIRREGRTPTGFSEAAGESENGS